MSAIDFSKELNEEQLAVVTGADGSCLVLAGAGSGKTRTIVYRVAYLVSRGVSPESILLLTFTNKAAAEMMGRIGELLGSGSGSVRVFGGTFHSVANRILRLYGDRLGYTPAFTILDSDDSKSLIKSCLKELGLDAAGKRFPSPGVIQDALSYSRNSLRPFAEAVERSRPHLASVIPDMERVVALYRKKKREANAMDFDDLLENICELLDKEPSILKRLQDRFRYILVDEFQDTNALQVSLVRRLAPPGANLLVVGDDAQSIYSFRAADVRNILDFPKHYPGARIFKLRTNYRSTPQILDLANDIIARNCDQFPKELVAVAPKSARPALVPAASASREAEFIADRIEEMLRYGVPEREIAVLFRATHHSQALEFELMRRGREYDYRGGLRFFERAHIKDALAFLRVRDNFLDEAAWLRILSTLSGIGETSAARIFAAFRAAGSLARAAMISPEGLVTAKGLAGWRDLTAILESISAAGDRPTELIKAVLDSSYGDYLLKEYTDGQARLEDLEQLARFSEPYAKASDFLAESALDESVASKRENRGDRVVLSTIHQAKGLEWGSVFVMHLTSSSFPNRRALEEPGGLEEERRLFYVAVTRAKRNLWLSYPASIGRGSFEYEERSMFLDELEPSTVEDPSAKTAADDAGFAEEETVEIDASGEPFSVSAVRQRMNKVKQDWRKRSFLRDV
jgi:DNA helicase-2/ATP-dependent DNA helicase PcrA